MAEKEQQSLDSLGEKAPAEPQESGSGPEAPAEPAAPPAKSQRKHRCANASCIFKQEPMRCERLNFQNSYNYFCEKCAEAIRKKWVCHYCHYISVEGDTQQDHADWVQCDFQKCGRWTHVDCEQLHGHGNIRAVLSEQHFKYYCPVCRNLKNIKKQQQQKEGARAEPRRADRFGGADDYRKAMLGK